MHHIRVHDKSFVLALSGEDILSRIRTLAEQISRDYESKDVLFIGVLNGSFLFAADLVREVTIPCRITFVKLASYQGTQSTGEVKTLLGLNEPLEGKHVVILEDIIDSGLTLQHLLQLLEQQQPASLRVASLLYKPGAVKVKLPVDYVGFEMENDFLVGYGLDYDGYGRNLKDIYKHKHV